MDNIVISPGDEVTIMQIDGLGLRGSFVRFEQVFDNVVIVIKDPKQIGKFSYIRWEVIGGFDVRKQSIT